MATATRKSTYDPGQPGEILEKGHGVYHVQSHRTEDAYYSVDLNQGTCTCPHAQYRDPEGGCKHFIQAKAEAVRLTREKARTMRASELRAALDAYQYRPEIEDAIKEVIFEKLYSLVAEIQEQVRNREYCRI